jgi:hypothetical protein
MKRNSLCLPFCTNCIAIVLRCAIARDAGLEPWESDRLLYNFTDDLLAVIGYSGTGITRCQLTMCSRMATL